MGPKLGEVLASTYGLHHSLDGLPQILEFWRRSRIRSQAKKKLRTEGTRQGSEVAKLLG